MKTIFLWLASWLLPLSLIMFFVIVFTTGNTLGGFLVALLIQGLFYLLLTRRNRGGKK